MSFYLKNVPSLMFFTGSHAEYHTPRDTADTLNYEGLVKVAQVVGKTAQVLVGTSAGHSASGPMKLTYQKVESSHRQMEGRSFRVYLGTIPDYTQEKINGVRISGTSKGSPAEKAGLLEGDVIKGLAGTKIENLYDYVYVLQGLKANQKVPIQVERQGQNLTLDLTPIMKE
jgi:S1-C subfamily serine protease